MGGRREKEKDEKVAPEGTSPQELLTQMNQEEGGRGGSRHACCLRATIFLQMATASPIKKRTATRERRCECCCINECGLDVARPYLVRSTAETPDARLERV
eukprot:scaffold8826_cov117-Isochrysis_galbana.AAC.3